jgi:hypothetical protein
MRRGPVLFSRGTILPEAETMMWVLMLLTGLAAFAAMFGFVFACDRL